MKRLLALVLLTGCAHVTPLPPPGPPTIPDVTAYLAQQRCPDGVLQLAEPACPAQPQRASDLMLMRRYDLGAPAPLPGYAAQDGFVSDDGSYYVNSWSFAPSFGDLAAVVGNGGEAYVTDGHTVRIALTQDGGKPGVLQGFYGAHCGGTGWVAFRDDAPTGSWKTVTASLNDLPVPSACSAANSSPTRYRLEQVTIGFNIGPETLPCVISEHYDISPNMERSYWCKGVGRVVWEAWTKVNPAGSDLADRCPGTSFTDLPQGAGWRLQDCRYAVNLVATAGTPMTGDQFGWPPSVKAMP